MASMNKTTTGRMRTTNRSGHAAYRLDDRTRLLTMALTTMLGEDKYYGDTTSDLIQLAESICYRGDGEYVAKLAVWARTKGNLRSVSHALIAVVVRYCSGEPFVRPAVRAVASVRGDDGTEIMATYLSMYGDEDKARHPNALRRGVRDALQKSKPFSIAKYQSKNREFKLRDSIRLNRPRSHGKDQSDAFDACVAGTLGMPKGWETELSERGNTKEVWDELNRENRLGIFAQLRNLRNMIQTGADIDPVLDSIRNPWVIRNSKILPFRFYSAYQELQKAGLATTKVTKALDVAMSKACANVEGLTGRTAVLIDTSGSMSWSVSQRSVTSCRDIAAVLGAMVTHVADDAWVCGFDNYANVIPMAGTSILSDVSMVPAAGGGTNMEAGIELLMRSGFDADRVVILSDNECNSGGRWYGRNNAKTIQSGIDEYRRKVGHDVWCHAIDLQGYGTTQVLGGHTQVLAGWSENVLRFIAYAEQGFGNMVGEIEKVEL